MPRLFKVLLMLLAISALFQNQNALAQEGITRDPSTGDYSISYFATDDTGNETLRQTVFVPSTKINPAIRSEFAISHSGNITYRYALRNGAGALQAIQVFTVDPATGVKTPSPASTNRPNGGQITAPAPWKVLATTNRNGAFRIVWRYPSSGGLWPPQTQPGFGFESADLPGVVSAGVAGNAPAFAGLGENGFDPDSDLGKQFQQLVMHDYIDVWIAAPVITLTRPVNATSILTQLRALVATWPSKQLINQTFASNLDALFQTAVTALSQGNIQQAVSALKAVRQSVLPLHGETGDEEGQIASEKTRGRGGSQSNTLAAKVLLFELALEKRIP